MKAGKLIMKEIDSRAHVGLLIKFLNNAIINEINRQLTSFNLTGSQHEILVFIDRYGECKDVFQKDIEKHFKLTNPTVTGIVKRLEEKEMLIRSASDEDARYKCLHITNKGKETLKCSYECGIKKIEAKLVNNMTEEEESEFKRLLYKALKNLEG